MKLAVLHNHPIHYKHLLFQEMAKAGADFEVLFVAGQSSLRNEAIPLSQDLYPYQVGLPGAYEAAPALSRAAFAWRALSNVRPEIVIVSGYHGLECWMAWLWARLRRRPLVMWYESNEFDYPRHWHLEWLKRIFVSGLDGAHVYGASNKAYLVKLGMRPDAVTLKRAVVDVNTFATPASERPHREDGRTRLIYVGRLAEEKNLSFLLRGVAKANLRLRGKSLSLTVAGSGPLETQLRRECAELGIEHLVEFVGYCPQKELPRLYAKADILVLPSVREPWGLVSLEAMLCGLPVLVSTQCGCAFDVVTPDTGWTFSPWDEAGFVDLLTQLPEIPPDRLAAMGNQAWALAEQYSATACAERIMQSLRAIGGWKAGGAAPQVVGVGE
jgi:glycosyltransferase involved in cell wall biosynthesis